MHIFLWLLAFVGLVPAHIAGRKGENVFLWWLYGTILIFIALPHAIRLEPKPGSEEAWRRRIARLNMMSRSSGNRRI